MIPVGRSAPSIPTSHGIARRSPSPAETPPVSQHDEVSRSSALWIQQEPPSRRMRVRAAVPHNCESHSCIISRSTCHLARAMRNVPSWSSHPQHPCPPGPQCRSSHACSRRSRLGSAPREHVGRSPPFSSHASRHQWRYPETCIARTYYRPASPVDIMM